MTLPSAGVSNQLLGVDPSAVFWDLALSLRGLGLRSATLMSQPACWSSWADCLGMVQQRHPTVSAHIVHALCYQPQFGKKGRKLWRERGKKARNVGPPTLLGPPRFLGPLVPPPLCFKFWTGMKVCSTDSLLLAELANSLAQADVPVTSCVHCAWDAPQHCRNPKMG